MSRLIQSLPCVAFGVLLLVGIALITAAQVTPWHSSEAFYAEYERLLAQWGDISFDAMSQRFHALQDQYRTNKWLYADLGYLCVALACTIGLLTMLRVRPTRVLLSASARASAIGLFVLGYCGFWLGTAAAAIHTTGRQLVPAWADSVAIPVIGAVAGAVLFAIPIGALLLWPLMRGPLQTVPLNALDRDNPGRGLLVGLIYVAVALSFAGLAVSAAASAGSWAVTPALLVLAWLALNARVLAFAPRQAANSDPRSPLQAPQA